MKDFKKGLIALGAQQFNEVAAFYKRLFDSEPVKTIGESYVEFEVAGLHIGIFRPREKNLEQFENNMNTGHGLSICFEIKNLDDLIADCRAKNLAIGEPIVTKHGREAFLFDPAGNRLIFSQMNEGE